MSGILEDLYRHNEWANLRLLEVCRTLTDEQLDATTVGAFGSIRSTLLHFADDGGYVKVLGGVYDGPVIDEDAPFPGFDVLQEAFVATARGLVERAQAAAAGSYTARATDGWTGDAEVVLVQALNHATEHRSQICTILTSLGIEAPTLDGWEWGFATGRGRMP
jgi:uncharacterized damage-inducible protein DinB